MKMEQGYLCLVLHCHLPFVRHPEHETFLEEDWLFEAVTESYRPLLAVFEALEREGIEFRATLCMSPTLCEMLADEMLQERCGRYIQRRLELTEREAALRRGTELEEAALVCRGVYRRAWEAFEGRGGGAHPGLQGLLDGFARLQREGFLEIIASSATHAILPLVLTPEALFAQVEQGCRSYARHFGRRPRGMWLPECAYRPGIEEVLSGCGLEFFFLESHGLLLADPRPAGGVFAPIVTPAGPAAFARDIESSKQVWSRDEGYPGDADYREFYRDLGFDAPYERIAPCLSADGVRHGIGVKYHRVTGDVPSERKELYRPGPARAKAEGHAAHFLDSRREQARRLAPIIGRAPIMVAPYDAELFGHWWFEGPQFLDFLLRKAARDQDDILLVTPSDYLARNPGRQVARPATSSWGFEGYFDVWTNGSNDWIYPHLHEAERAMISLAAANPGAEGLLRRTLNQCARELMLAQSSDWPFLISVGTAPHYAARRVNEHLSRLRSLADQVRSRRIAGDELARLESRDNIFSALDYSLYSPA